MDFNWYGIEDKAYYLVFINYEINWLSRGFDKKTLYWSYDKCFFNMFYDEFDMDYLKFYWFIWSKPRWYKKKQKTDRTGL